MTIERDKANPNISIVHTAQGEIRFDFGAEGKSVDVNIPGIPKLDTFKEDGRKELEALMDKTFNPSADSTQKLKDLQAKFNETIIATQNGKALEVGTSEKLTSFDTGGGGLTRKVDASGMPVQDVALGINLAEVVKTPYRDNMGRDHKMKPEDILRHELFHYVDKASDPNQVSKNKDDPASDLMFKERRAVWYVNQFQLAEDPPRAQRISYKTLNSDLDTGIAGADGKVAGSTLPGAEKGYPEPSPTNHREYPWNKQAENSSSSSISDFSEKLALPDNLLSNLKGGAVAINHGDYFSPEQKTQLNALVAGNLNDSLNETFKLKQPEKEV
ncbi:MAG: hypothetical protein HOP26_01060 [Methylotenera sp.]|nr:hypothetical protein [Methylotenera sp.]MDD4926229.1 hypothetical protein [Methylotenera sp.]NOS94996.1 hypothetical protein [Methylotenera sp.]